ncbi:MULTISPECIES: hypothetical protein [Streptomyces]|uniref:hypothetical protein n=1 Tax=Streptomyces TaxID=1883 RepID=UPI00163C417F|nr:MULTISPECIES: hypothetical protein [Streptomyces]MBC2877498.1 hypothetical protein [Streptomyces sp. TYQ1024]UBI36257.1 hypothetical protein K7I03_07150 [Streptomyces mobaraensis]UKW28851.1 hypothetical protein MCU78_07135 [Streptomyces sp. TYQ1024]
MSVPLDLHFHDTQRPGLTAGDYTVTVTQKVTSPKNGELGKEFFQPLVQPVQVTAPRFALDPVTVHAVHPANGAAGRFDQTLPHCTLRRPSLPWQRLIGSDSKHQDLPWMALLVLGPGEIREDPAAGGLATPRTGADVPKAESGVAVPAVTPTAAEQTLPCRTIDVLATVFTQVCPRDSDDELAHAAHVRKARPAAAFRGEELVEGDFAVLLAGRLPRKPGPYAAHLVSLEGHGKHLTGTLPGNPQWVRLVSLWSWTFTSKDGARHFPAVVGKLAGGDLLLRRPPRGTAGGSAAEKEVRRRLNRGYVPVPSRLSSGEQTLAWYRGPLTPVVPPALPDLPQHVTSGDHAAVYLPDHGVFDIGYASAWSLGRALALSDADYVASLTGWLAVARRTVTRMLTTGPPESGRWRVPASPGERLTAWFANGPADAVAAALDVPPGSRPDRESGPPSGERTAPAAALLHTRAEEVADALAALGAETTELVNARSWLRRLELLEQVPFGYLVPDAGMLPPESLRFFHVDQDWLSRLCAGARGVGRFGEVDALAERAMTAIAPPPRPQAGLLLRSALVSDCPDLVIEVSGGAGVEILRRSVLAADVLICLFDAVPASVVLREPAQGLHFGIDGPDVINLRQPTGTDCGKEITGRKLTGLAAFQRDTQRAVFRFGTHSSSLSTALAKQHGIGSAAFKSSDLAVQLLNSPHQITFPAA